MALKKRVKEAAEAVTKRSKDIKEGGKSPLLIPIDTSKVISTGSTLLDLTISGGRIRGGGLPGGIFVEVAGTSGAGKTAVLVETAINAQTKGGEAQFLDPEARLDHEYAKIYGMQLSEHNYSRPQTVNEVMDLIQKWQPSNKKVINVCAVDSLAALSTELEMESGDKMGMKRAKDFSEGLRKLARKIAQEHKIVLCSNQLRQTQWGKKAPGGEAIGFYASLRLFARKVKDIEQKKKIEDVSFEKVIGIETEITVEKSSIDDPFRSCKIYIIFGFGIDDVRGNLQWLKEVNKTSVYEAVDASFQQMSAAIKYIEKKNYEKELREIVIEKWMTIEQAFKMERKKKVRF